MLNPSSLPSLLNQLQQQYPAASLVAELVTVHQDNFVVRALVQMAGVTLASGMAAHIDIEAAEDRAKIRSLEALGLNTSSVNTSSVNTSSVNTSSVNTSSVNTSSINTASSSEIGDRYVLPSPTGLPPLSGSLLDAYRPPVEIDTQPQGSDFSSDFVTASGAIAPAELAAAQSSASHWSSFDDQPFGDRHFPTDTRLPDPGDFSSDFDPGSELMEIPELSELVESPDFDAGFDGASLADSDFGATPAPVANLYDDITQSEAALAPVAPAIDKPRSDKPKSSRKKSTATSESSDTPAVAPGTDPAAAPAADSPAVSWTATTPVRERSDDIARIGLEMKRLGWTTDKGRDHIKTVYGKRSRQELSDDELGDFLNYLESQPVGAGT